MADLFSIVIFSFVCGKKIKLYFTGFINPSFSARRMDPVFSISQAQIGCKPLLSISSKVLTQTANAKPLHRLSSSVIIPSSVTIMVPISTSSGSTSVKEPSSSMNAESGRISISLVMLVLLFSTANAWKSSPT